MVDAFILVQAEPAGRPHFLDGLRSHEDVIYAEMVTGRTTLSSGFACPISTTWNCSLNS